MDARAVSSHHRRRCMAIARVVSAIGSALLLAGCAAAPAAPSTAPVVSAAAATIVPTATPSSAPAPRPTATATVPPSPVAPSALPGMLRSVTQTAFTPPEGSIELIMKGPPPIFRPADLTAAAGDVVFFLRNESPRTDPHGVHTLAIGRDQATPIAQSADVQPGRKAVFTIIGLEAGEYVIWCTFPGHAGLGQVGTLTVE